MLILSNCLTKVVDEGCIKVANSLVKRLKNNSDNHFVVTYERESALSDEHLSLNKFLISKRLFSLIKERGERVLYLPFPAKPISTAIRVFILSLFAKCGMDVLITMQNECDFVSKLLFKLSGANFVFLSAPAAARFSKHVGEKRVKHLKCGVDTKRFLPVDQDKARALKEKYGLDSDRAVVLHVGHLNRGRNVAELLKLADEFTVLLVTSTLTKSEQDKELRASLEAANIKIIDDYIPDIEEIYQLSDVYFFPVVEYGKCIDVPLSCLEAAACNKCVVTTDYGEMKEFCGKDGFYFIDSFEKDDLKTLVKKAISSKAQTRSAVLEYDFDNAALYFGLDGE